MDYRDRILEIVKQSPVVPTQVAKRLETNSIMAGAMLSEMCDRKILKTSAIKVGGSPLYYVPGTEHMLLNFTQSLNEKDRRVLERLKEAGVMRESAEDPLTRVSLQSLKDFAVPLVVRHEGGEERFFKFFLLQDSEAEPLIRQMVEPPKEVLVDAAGSQEAVAPNPPKVEVAVPKVEPPKAEVQTEQVVEKKVGRPAGELQKVEEVRNVPAGEVQSALQSADLSVLIGDFGESVKALFGRHKVVARELTIVKKKTEYDAVVDVPSAFGALPYFVKVRSKKRISDADISAAFVQGQLRKLPVLFVTDGELSRQAKAVLEQLKAVTVYKV